jgi:hypothetical protein
MQTDDILLLVDQNFAVLKEETIKSTKIMIKNRKRLTSDNSMKFNETRVERLDSNSNENDSNEAIYFRRKTHIQDIQLIQSIKSSSIINAREKIRVNLISRKQYIAQRARDVFLETICQLKITIDLSHAIQSIESTFSSDDIITLNKQLK